MLDKYDITDIEELSRDRKNIPESDYVALNYAYGYLYWMKKYAGLDESAFVNATIEHGVGPWILPVDQKEVGHCNSGHIVASRFAKEIIERETKKKVYTVGPYIAYAEDYYSEIEFLNKKKQWGRTLLAFPAHGFPGRNVRYDVEAFCDEIDNVGKAFDTKIVSLTYHDILDGYVNSYENRGYIVVSSGYIEDKFFLSRQKTILSLADAVVANDYLTGLSFAVFMKKPVYVYQQTVKMINDGYNSSGENIHIDYTKKYEFFKLCSDPEFKGQIDQEMWGRYYFGLDEVKTREEMKALLQVFIRRDVNG